ncbi:MAG: hypothetical protein AAF968_06360, partial [Pseudomonadota bacterium]
MSVFTQYCTGPLTESCTRGAGGQAVTAGPLTQCAGVQTCGAQPQVGFTQGGMTMCGGVQTCGPQGCPVTNASQGQICCGGGGAQAAGRGAFGTTEVTICPVTQCDHVHTCGNHCGPSTEGALTQCVGMHTCNEACPMTNGPATQCGGIETCGVTCPPPPAGAWQPQGAVTMGGMTMCGGVQTCGPQGCPVTNASQGQICCGGGGAQAAGRGAFGTTEVTICPVTQCDHVHTCGNHC